MFFHVAEWMQAVALETGADYGIVDLSGNNVVKLNRDHRWNIVVRIWIVGIAGTERRSGKEEHQAEHDAAKMVMTKHPCSLRQQTILPAR